MPRPLLLSPLPMLRPRRPPERASLVAAAHSAALASAGRARPRGRARRCSAIRRLGCPAKPWARGCPA
eukprot:11197620-Alexandrium_andersonii.AAC.1